MLSEIAKNELTKAAVQYQMALKLGKSADTIRRWVNDDDKKVTQLDFIQAAYEITGLTLEELFTNTKKYTFV